MWFNYKYLNVLLFDDDDEDFAKWAFESVRAMNFWERQN